MSSRIAEQLLQAAAEFLAEAVRHGGPEYSKAVSAQARVDVRVRDIGGDQPRAEVVVLDGATERVVAHVDLAPAARRRSVN